MITRQWDRLTLGRMARKLGFSRDTLEKVCRLADVLKFVESDELLAEGIALKGGTAINLTIFDLPRLSVDIDLDYCRSIDREDMLSDREIITDRISKYMVANGYVLSSIVQSEQHSHRKNSSLIILGKYHPSRLSEIWIRCFVRENDLT